MLAETTTTVRSGGIDRDIHLPATAKRELVAFITGELPQWRDHPDRPDASAETDLTEYLCDHLNSAAYDSTAWSHVQFRTEIADEARGGRKIDLGAKPLSAALVIEGRRHSRFDVLFPIECKRLPTPTGKDRDEREYVITERGTTGGIQRFKLGCHGAAHTFAAMIAYVQKRSCAHWLERVNAWIHDLAEGADSVWSESDLLQSQSNDTARGICTHVSRHARSGGLAPCELQHLWVKMNPTTS
jgi:hypothetical protein